MKKLILLLFITALMLNCSKNESQMDKSVSFSIIAQGNLNGQEGISKSSINIKNSNAWADLMNQMNSINNQTNHFTETNIDFDSFQIIAVFDKIYNNGGHTIDIINITENESNLVVYLKNLKEGDLTSIITQPYQIVKISKIEKNIVFK